MSTTIVLLLRERPGLGTFVPIDATFADIASHIAMQSNLVGGGTQSRYRTADGPIPQQEAMRRLLSSVTRHRVHVSAFLSVSGGDLASRLTLMVPRTKASAGAAVAFAGQEMSTTVG